jgi:hypothetical protein
VRAARRPLSSFKHLVTCYSNPVHLAAAACAEGTPHYPHGRCVRRPRSATRGRVVPLQVAPPFYPCCVLR